MLQSRATLFELISGRLAWLGQRQAVLGQNVANADTPGYRPRDLAPADFAALVAGRMESRLEPARTAAAHLPPLAGVAGRFRELVDRDAELKPSGNGVDLPDQMRRMATTEQEHQLATNLYRRYVGMMRTAVGMPQA
ncbi:MAG: flagellar basal body rod protein FlgB [Geminicoccaceae bacterium]